MHRLAMCLLVCFGMVACGEDEALTQAQVEAMSDQEAMALLNCQMEQVAAEKGERAAADYLIGLMTGGGTGEKEVMDALKEGGPSFQVLLWEEGYTCPELVP